MFWRHCLHIATVLPGDGVQDVIHFVELLEDLHDPAWQKRVVQPYRNLAEKTIPCLSNHFGMTSACCSMHFGLLRLGCKHHNPDYLDVHNLEFHATEKNLRVFQVLLVFRLVHHVLASLSLPSPAPHFTFEPRPTTQVRSRPCPP